MFGVFELCWLFGVVGFDEMRDKAVFKAYEHLLSINVFRLMCATKNGSEGFKMALERKIYVGMVVKLSFA